MKKYSILLLENKEYNVNCFNQYLDRNYYKINHFNDLSLFNNSIISNGIDMLIVGEDFHEFSSQIIQTIKSTSKLIPILFILSKNDETKIINSLEIGADGFIFSPINSKQLLAKIKSYVEKYKLLYNKFEEKLQNIRGNITMVLPHEFRTSLSGINGLSKTISQISYEKSYLTKGEIQEIFEMSNLIFHSCSYLSKITENILLYSKLQLLKHNQEKDYEFNDKSITNPKEMIEDIAYSLTLDTEREKDIQMKLQNAHINISQYHFQKIIYELIDNAIKFSPVNTEVLITSEKISDKFLTIIVDKGRGMSQIQILEIDAFKQFDRNIYEQQGNGLGLIIAKELTEINNGIFLIESQKELGTKITLEFPILD
jgi:two-component system, sensor histidine kinase and response regulator